jgi:hypothetical protein
MSAPRTRRRSYNPQRLAQSLVPHLTDEDVASIPAFEAALYRLDRQSLGAELRACRLILDSDSEMAEEPDSGLYRYTIGRMPTDKRSYHLARRVERIDRLRRLVRSYRSREAVR